MLPLIFGANNLGHQVKGSRAPLIKAYLQTLEFFLKAPANHEKRHRQNFEVQHLSAQVLMHTRECSLLLILIQLYRE